MTGLISFAAYVVGLCIGVYFGRKHGFLNGQAAVWAYIMAELNKAKREREETK